MSWKENRVHDVERTINMQFPGTSSFCGCGEFFSNECSSLILPKVGERFQLALISETRNRDEGKRGCFSRNLFPLKIVQSANHTFRPVEMSKYIFVRVPRNMQRSILGSSKARDEAREYSVICEIHSSLDRALKRFSNSSIA